MSEVDNKEVRTTPETNFNPFKITLKNVDLNSGRPLEGAKFKVTGRHEQWDQVTCDSFGQAEITISDEASWKFEQTKVPSGYQLNSTPIVADITANSFEVIGDQESDWYDYDSPSKTLTVKNAPIQPQPEGQPEGGTKMKVATDNSLKELIKLVKSQPSTSSGEILNVTLDYTIPSYSQVEVETKRKRVYADIPCVNSKVAMNAQITPNDNIENVSLLTYAEPFDGYIRCYFSEQPTESYIIDSVELTPVTSIVKKK